MPSISAAVEAVPLQRVGVTLAGWSTDDDVVVYREAAGVRVPVRGADPAAPIGGGFFVWDYEAPFNVPVTYTAHDAGTDYVSAPVTLAETRPWLRVPGLPFLDLPVVPDRYPALQRSRPAAVLRPLGRRRPVVISDLLQSAEGTIGFYAPTDSDADSLVALLEQAPVVLLHLPGTRWGARYIALRGVAESRSTGYADTEFTLFEVEFVVVDRPEGGLFGDPSNSYQAVLDTFASYSALLAAEDDYFDVLAGVV